MELVNENRISNEIKAENVRSSSLFHDNKVSCTVESNNEQIISSNLKKQDSQLTTLYPSCANSPIYENVQQQNYVQQQGYGSQPVYGQQNYYGQQQIYSQPPMYGQQQGYQVGPYG